MLNPLKDTSLATAVSVELTDVWAYPPVTSNAAKLKTAKTATNKVTTTFSLIPPLLLRYLLFKSEFYRYETTS